jgi:hypothetical protein
LGHKFYNLAPVGQNENTEKNRTERTGRHSYGYQRVCRDRASDEIIMEVREKEVVIRPRIDPEGLLEWV